MPVEWVSLTDLCNELNMDKRTFKASYLEENPPQRHVGNRRSWTRADADRIKREILGIETYDYADHEDETA